MKAGRRGKIYWDTCVLIAYLADERCWDESILRGIADIVAQVDANDIILFTSTISRTEVFVGKLTADGKTKYSDLFRRSNVVEISPDSRITDRASSIREHYSENRIVITVPDAIHLATAILYSADEMQTLDGKSRRGLIRFNGDVAGSNLRIVVPYPLGSMTPPQRRLPKSRESFSKKIKAHRGEFQRK